MPFIGPCRHFRKAKGRGLRIAASGCALLAMTKMGDYPSIPLSCSSSASRPTEEPLTFLAPQRSTEELREFPPFQRLTEEVRESLTPQRPTEEPLTFLAPQRSTEELREFPPFQRLTEEVRESLTPRRSTEEIQEFLALWLRGLARALF